MSPRAFAWLARCAAWLTGTGLLALLLLGGGARRMDQALYDFNMQHWGYAPGAGVVIVAIDPKSLDALGRWPFPRSLHARLLDRLSADGVRAVALDITMSTPDTAQPDNDRLLAAAMRRNGHVVMPVSAEPIDLGGMLEETLPVPPLAQAAAALGQVDVAQDADGLTRGAYLTAGLGRPYWPLLALALYRVARPAAADAPLPGLRNPAPMHASPYLWVRDHYVLLRYAGPAGTFGWVSYVDVLDGRVPASLLKGKLVLVGATAEGMGDIIRTPVGLMPGVEYQANVLESLRRGLLITPLGFTAQFAIGALLLALPCLLYGLPGLRRRWRAALAGVLLALAASLFLLRVVGWWWPPSPCLLVSVAGWLSERGLRRPAIGAPA